LGVSGMAKMARNASIGDNLHFPAAANGERSDNKAYACEQAGFCLSANEDL
jgi:hypothetical protein